MQPPEEILEPRKPALTATAIYLLATLSLTWPMLLGRFLVNPLSDQYTAGYSFRLFGAEMFRATGAIPQWNPYLLGGLPFIGAMHGDIFYPTAWLRWFLPVDVAMNLGFALHLLLAGVLAYAFLRGLRLRWTAALVGGLAYQLTGMVASLVNPGHDGKMFVSALAPLAFLALLRAIRDRRWSWYGVFALVVGLALVSPHYQLTYYLLVACGMWTLYLVFWDPERTPDGSWLTPIALAFLGVLLGVAISAIQALPFLDYIPYSPRGAGGGSTGWQYAIGFSMPPEELVSTVLPQFNGIVEHYWGQNFFKLHSEYLGALVVALAVFAWGRDRGGGGGREGEGRSYRALLWALTGIGGFFLLISLGGHTPFYRLWYEVMPMMKKVRAPGMAFYLVALSASVAAGIGTERLLAGEVPRRVFWTVFGVLGGMALVGVAGGLQPIAEALALPRQADAVAANAGQLRSGALRLLVVVTAGGAMYWLVLTHRARGWLAALGLVAVVGADLWSVDREFFRFSPPASELYAPDEIIDYMRSEGGPSRVLNAGVYDRSFLMAFDIQTALGYHGNELRFYDDLWGGKNVWRNASRPQLWDLMAVNFVVAPNVQQIPGYTRVLGPVKTTEGRFGVLYQRDTTAPYVRVLPAAVKVLDDQIVATLMDPRFPYDQVALFPDSATIDVPPLEALPAPATVRATLAEWNPGRMEIALEGQDSRETFLLVAESWHPGWHARVDGVETPVVRGQEALISVPLPPGARRVTLRFTTPGYRTGKIVSALALITALLIIAGPAVRSRRAADG